MFFMVFDTRRGGFRVVLGSSQRGILSSFCQTHVFATKPSQTGPTPITFKSTCVFFSQGYRISRFGPCVFWKIVEFVLGGFGIF